MAGVDWLATLGALRDRLEGKRSRGASTLSMQVAAFLAPDLARPGARGWLDKIRQMRAGLAIDGAWRKDQILEAYLNLAGYRGEAQGIGAAALGLFGKTPDALSRDDALLLVALLPDPQASAPTVARRACALAREKDCARFEAAAYSMFGPARSLQLDPGPRPASRVAAADPAGAQGHHDARHQYPARRDRRVEAPARGTGRQPGARRRGGGARQCQRRRACLCRRDRRQFDRRRGRWRERLSPGRIDAQAVPLRAGDRAGYLTAASILDDSPVQLDTASGLYVPQNYDKGFKGPVSVRSALAGSLNVPAVRTLLLVGVDAFRDRLFDTGYQGLVEDGDYYGYSASHSDRPR